jgi:hypothetical protein
MKTSELPKIGHVGWARFKVMGDVCCSGNKEYFRATFFGIMDHFVDSNHTVSTEIESNENF